MVYTGTYIDENGVGHEISLTEEDSIEALKNDRDALLRRYNTQRVTVRQVKAQEGEAMRFQLTLHAPTHYLTSEDDTEPKLLHDMIHDPSVTRYDSVANSDVVAWHKRGVERGAFPTIAPKELWAPEIPPLPRRRAVVTPPPLPRRRTARS